MKNREMTVAFSNNVDCFSSILTVPPAAVTSAAGGGECYYRLPRSSCCHCSSDKRDSRFAPHAAALKTTPPGLFWR